MGAKENPTATILKLYPTCIPDVYPTPPGLTGTATHGVLCQHGLHADGVVARVRWQCSTCSHVDADRLWGAQHRVGTDTGDSVAWVGRKGRVMERSAEHCLPLAACRIPGVQKEGGGCLEVPSPPP